MKQLELFHLLGPLKTIMLSTSYCFLLMFSLSVFTGDALAGVAVFDTVTTATEPVKLKALTKGRLFSEGGKLVTFYVSNREVGTTLSGGDGYAFMKYESAFPGIKNVRVKSGEDADEGILLITGKGDRVILIEMESSLFDALLSFKPDKKSIGALAELSKKFKILYITSLVGVEQSRKWIRDNEFPASPVLKWEGAALLEDLKEKHIPLYAIIASSDILKDASGIEKRFSFSETEDGTEVEGWDDLIEKIE